jgi:hypothetical protein
LPKCRAYLGEFWAKKNQKKMRPNGKISPNVVTLQEALLFTFCSLGFFSGKMQRMTFPFF